MSPTRMPGEFSLLRISLEAALVGELQRQLKERTMIYDVQAKEEAARADGLPRDAYYDLPYEEWSAVKARHHASHS